MKNIDLIKSLIPDNYEIININDNKSITIDDKCFDYSYSSIDIIVDDDNKFIVRYGKEGGYIHVYDILNIELLNPTIKRIRKIMNMRHASNEIEDDIYDFFNRMERELKIDKIL